MRRQLAAKTANWLERGYPTAKALYMWRMQRSFNAAQDGPILVLQMGKVGSMSVQAGLEAQNLSRRIYHVHFLSAERTRQTERDRRSYFRTERHHDLVRPWLNQFLLKQYQRSGRQRRWKIITLTREPVGRNLSAFFENLVVREIGRPGEYEIQSDYYGIDPVAVSVDEPGEIIDLFFKNGKHDSPLRFFDTEIRDIFGIDVFRENFPQQQGFKVYEGDRADLLVLKLEKLKECAGEAFAEFLDLDGFQLVQRNVGAKKIYAPLYHAVKKKIKVPEDYADMLYNSEYMRTFYSDDEVREARQMWQR